MMILLQTEQMNTGSIHFFEYKPELFDLCNISKTFIYVDGIVVYAVSCPPCFPIAQILAI